MERGHANVFPGSIYYVSERCSDKSPIPRYVFPTFSKMVWFAMYKQIGIVFTLNNNNNKNLIIIIIICQQALSLGGLGTFDGINEDQMLMGKKVGCSTKY